MLLIPRTVRAILAKGWAEGWAEGFAEGLAKGKAEGKDLVWEAQLQRIKEAYERFGIEVDGILALPDTPEVREFLWGDSPEKPADSK